MKFKLGSQFDETKFANKLGRFFLVSAALLALMLIFALAAFFLVVRGPEQTMVPNVVGKDIIEALLEMQQKELYPKIQLRFSQSAAEKNKILEQEPQQGTIVKAGRRIRLVVSQGVQLSRIENYVGRTIGDVRNELKTYVSGNETPLLSIKEPLMYEVSAKPAGTILEQSPAPGTGISGPAHLSFVVSRGKEEETAMPVIIGLKIEDAVKEINKAGIQVSFKIQDAGARQTPETIISQNPAGGVLLPKGKIAELTVAAPSKTQLSDDEIYLLFTHEIAVNPFPVATKLEAVLPDGSRQTLAEMNHLGGQFSFPCRVKRGSALVLSILGSEIYREPLN